MIFMNCLRTRLKFPVTLLMFACTLSWSLQSRASIWVNASAVVVSGAIDTDTRVIRLNSENSTANLKPGMPVTGTGILPGSYIVQILSGDQILINQSVTGNNSNVNLTFDDTTVIHDPVTGADNFTKNGSDKVVLVGTNTTTGAFTINDGIVQVGGVNFSGRTVIHDVLSNSGSLVFGATGAPTLNFASNVLNTAPFERVGSLSGGSNAATILLTGGTSNTVMAFGGNNATTSFTGSIIGGVASGLLKEGNGIFTWINNNDAAFNGTVMVDSGGMIVGGSAGLGNGRFVGEGLGSNIVMSNKNGVSLTLASGGNEVVGFLTGGGFGTTRLFPNGSTGALLGNYLNQAGGELILANTNLILDNNTPNQVYSYGGIISGTGNLTKVGNNTMEVLGTSTYAGSTTIEAFAVNNTHSAIRLGAYGIHSGVGVNASAGFGSLSSTTHLMLSAGNVGSGRDVTFDLNGGSQTLGTVNSANVAGVKTVRLQGGALTIHTTAGNSGFYNGIFSGRGTINVTSTTGANGWELRATDLANNDAIQRGALNVLGGRVSLNDSRGALGDAVHVSVGAAGTLSVLDNETVGSLSGAGNVEITSGRTLVLASGPAGSVFDHAWSGNISGFGALTLATGGSLMVNSNQSYLGATRVSSGAALYLDYESGATNLIPGTLNLNGGSLYLSGGAAPEVISSGTTISAGASLIATQTGEADALLNLGNLIRNSTAGGVLNIRGGSATTTSTGQVGLGGILGGYATHRSVVAGTPAFSWAVPGAGGAAISGLADGSYSSSFGAGLNTDVTSLFTDVKVSGATGSLRFNTFGAQTLTIGGASDAQQTIVESGGIMVTPAVGAFDITITDQNRGNEELFGGGAFGVERELIVHQHNTRGTLTINATIGDNGGPSRLTKTGQGTLILTKLNTYSGQTAIYGGVLQLNTGGILGGASQPLINHGYLVINRSSITLPQIIEGTGILRQAGAGITTLNSDNTYTGPTQVLAGTLEISNAGNALGSTAGLTSVGSGATLSFSNVVVPETIVLKGGSTLRTSPSAGSSTLNGSLILGGNSTITLGGASSPLRLNGRVFAMQGSQLTVNGTGRLLLGNAANHFNGISLGAGTQLLLGADPLLDNNPLTIAPAVAGAAGRAPIVNNGTVITNTNNGHMVLGNAISGSGNFIQVRNTLYLTADNTYTGTTLAGGNFGFIGGGGLVGVANVNAEMRVGTDTYTGSVGTGAVTLQSSSGGNTNMRYHLARNVILANTFNINPFNDGSNARNSTLLRQGTGTTIFSGIINAGSHTAGTQAQRAVLQTEGGGRMIIRGELNNGPNNRINIINNGFFAFEGTNNYELWGVISGNNALVFNTTGTVTVQPARDQTNALVQSMTSNSTLYLSRGTMVINSDFDDSINNDMDMYVQRGATLQMNFNETIGSLLAQKGSLTVLGNGVTLRVDDNITRGNFGSITGGGEMHFDAVGGTAWHGMFGVSDYVGNVTIGSGTQITTLRVNSVADRFLPSALGAGEAINFGLAGSSLDTRLEYTGTGHSTDRDFNLSGASGTVRIAGNGRGGLVLNGNITITADGAKTLMLHGQNTQNVINGALQRNGRLLSISVGPNVGDNDVYGAGKWTLTNASSDFNGDISVDVGELEFAGDLGNGSTAFSVMGNLNVARTIDLATNNFNGRRFAFTGGGDNLGATGQPGSNGTIIFNDPGAGTATLGSNITFTSSYSSTTNPGNPEIMNNGEKVIVINGNLTSGATGNRSWILDGSNTGANTIAGSISNGTGNTVSVIKEGTGTWRLAGANTFTGAVTITRGTLEITGGSTIGDAAVVNLSNAGSDGSSAGGAALRVLSSETIGGLAGGLGTLVEISSGQTLRLLSAASQTYNGVISGEGGLWRDGDATARIQTLTNLNTYEGATLISSASNIAHRIDVLFLADGGEASGIGASSNAASNLVLNTGTGIGGLRWIGTTNQTTDRLLTLGAGVGAGGIWADGQSFGDFAPSIKFTNSGAIAFLAPNTTQTLTLRGARIAENEFSPQITNNGSGATILNKIEASTWIINGANTHTGGTTIGGGTLAVTHNNALGTGTVAINGGAGTGLQLRGGVTLANAVTNGTNLGGVGALTGVNRINGGVTLSGTNASFVNTVHDGASLRLAGTITGTVGTGTFLKAGRGDLILSGASNSFTGVTTVAGGSLILDYTTSNNTKLAAGSALHLGWATLGSATGFATGLGPSATVAAQTDLAPYSGGTLVLRGNAAAFTQVVASTLLNNGASRVVRDGGSASLQMGAITRTANNTLNAYGTLDLGAAGIATTSTTNTANILAIGSTAAITVNGTDWATGGGSVNAFSAYVTTFANGQHTNITAALTNLTATTTTTNTLRFNTNASGTVSLNLGAASALAMVAGGILVTKNMTDNVVISGGTLRRSATTANLDLVFHHHGTGLLTVNSVIANNTGVLALTKTGPSTMILGGANTNTGRVNLQQGVLQVGDGTAGTANARLGNLTAVGTAGNPVSLSEGATLLFNVANPSLVYTLGALNGGGLIHLAPTNTSTVMLVSTNTNWLGELRVDGGTLRVSTDANALGNLRGLATIGGGGALEFFGVSQTYTKRLILEDGALIRAVPNGTTNTGSTLSGVLTLNNSTSAGANFQVAANSTLTLSNMIRSSNGFTKTGNGILTLSGNQFQDILPGAPVGITTPNVNAALLGQVVVSEGQLWVGNIRALGGTGPGNETRVLNGATLDLRGQALNFVDSPDAFREVIHVSGTGVNGTGALRNSTGLGVFSHLVMDADALISGGGFLNASRLVLGSYDTNTNTGSVLEGNFTRNRPTIDGNDRILTVRSSATTNDANGAGVTLRDPNFTSPLQELVINEGILRIEKEFGPVSDFAGVTAANITNGITIAYSGPSLADKTNASLGVGPILSSRLNLWNNWDVHHTVNIMMDGATAALNGGHNYIDTGAGTIPNSRTYLDGTITLTGPASRNVFHVDASSNNNTIVEQSNMTGAIQAKLIVGGQIVGAGGLTKTGFRELRLTNNNTFTGDVNVLRFGTTAVRWQDNTVSVNGVDYQTFGDAEGWGEWGLTLAGANARLSGTGNVNLQRRGMITLDNSNVLDATSGVAGGNHNDRINNAASINFENGWLRIMGGSSDNTEALATAGGARLNVLSGSNFLDLMPTVDGTSMTLTIGEIARAPGSVLTFRNMDSTSTFGTLSGADTVRVQLLNIGSLAQVGAGTGMTSKKIIPGLLGGIIPHTLGEDIRELGFNNANASDYLTQARNQQFLAGSHFMTFDGGILRPLTDSEYFTPAADGLIDSLNGSAGQNINLTETFTRVRENVTINSLRFGPAADNNREGRNINDGTTLTDYTAAHNIQLYVDGTLKIDSGMISSAYFTTGNSSSLATFIIGGTLNFGNREAVINNQNAMVRFTDGIVVTGNLEVRSAIAGNAGLLKTGLAQVVLDGANTYRGLTSISNGTLFLRNGKSALGMGGPGNGVVIEGLGGLNSGNGIQVGSPSAFEDILVKPVAGDIQVMRTENDATRWYSNVTIDNVDMAGMVVHLPRIAAANSATSMINGNIFGGNTTISHNIDATLSRIVQMDAGNNIMLFRGQIGDKADINGNPIPISDPISTLPSLAGTRTNQNEVLRVTLAGSVESNFTFERQYNAAGRIQLSNGNLLVTYDPAAAGNDGGGFWTNTALSRIPNGDSTSSAFAVNGGTTSHGFTLVGGVVALTVPGQNFNMTSWSTSGTTAKWVGGFNDSGNVIYGTPGNTGILTTTGVATRLYSMSGGTVTFDMSLAGNVGTAPNNMGVIKVGRGNVVLRNTNQTAAATSNPQLSGGTLTLDYSGNNVALVGQQNAILAGGTLLAQSNLSTYSVANLAVTNAANSVLQLQLGATEVIAEGRGGQHMQISLGNMQGAGTLTRALGATMNLVEWAKGTGTGGIALNFNSANTLLSLDASIPWATYSTTPRTAVDFATVSLTDPVAITANRTSGNVNLSNISPAGALQVGMVVTGTGYVVGTIVIAVPTPTTAVLSIAPNATATAAAATARFNDVQQFNRPGGHFVNAVGSWTAGMDVSENGAGFTGALGGNETIKTLRFDTAANSQVTLNPGVALSFSGGGTLPGAILVSSNTGAANKTITGGTLSTSGSTELIFHQYGQGVLDVQSTITGTINTVINGPLTTDPGQVGTTGAVRFSANNTYDGRTIITGGVLEIGSVSALGVNPTDVSNDRLTLNGGTLRWTGTTASLQNRGIRLEGNGGVIDVANPDGNLVVGRALLGAQATLTSQEALRGDLIKTGVGALTFLGNQSLSGLMDIQQGTVITMVDTGDDGATAARTATVFGTNRSFADGTILRNGANVQVIMGNANNGQEWNIDEYFTFEGGNTFTYGGLLDVNANLALSGVLDDQFNIGNRRPLNLNGWLKVDGTTTFTVTNNGVLRLGNSAGYITGSGDIVKDGPGQLHFRTNTPDWKGGLVIREGSVYAANQADVLGSGHLTGKTIILGDADRQFTAELLVQNPDSVSGSWMFDIYHDIEVVYNPAQTKRLGIDNISNGNLVTFHGDVTMNDNLILLVRDVAIAAGGEQAYVNYNGSFKDGAVTSGNLLIQSNDSDATANNLTSGRTYGYAILGGDNSAWTGDVTISSNLVNNQDNTSILRLAHSKALTEANEVVMNFNSILQAGGQSVTIGSLNAQGGNGAFHGDAGTMSGNVNSSSEIIENAASTAGTLRIFQSTPAGYESSWDAFFRDGTLNSEFLAPGANILRPSAALSIVKAGDGWATLSLHNDYSGSTVVEGGILQVGRNGIGSTGRTGALGTTVMSGGVIAGSGVVQGGMTLLAGATLSPGDLAGRELGTLSVDGNAIFSTGSQTLMQIRLPSYNNPGAMNATDPLYSTWRNGVTTDSFSNALADLVTPVQHDMLHATGTINWGVGTQVTLINDGYTPKAGDIFRLFSGSGYAGAINVGPSLRTGGETGTDLTLFELGGNFLWDVSLFNSQGILMVVEADSAPMIIPAPVITAGPSRNPATGVFEPGDQVQLSVSATGAGTLLYQWYLNGAVVPGANQPVYQFQVNFNTKGVYSVSVTNDGGTTVAPTTVLIEVDAVPFIAVHPSPVTVNPGQNASFTVLASGQAPFEYQWLLNGVEIENATSQTLLLESVAEFDEGVYSVVVKNAAGEVTSNGAALTVNDPITQAIASRSPFPRAYVGETITFSVSHDGTPRDTGSPFSYVWRKGGTPISGGTGETLVLPNANAMLEGDYDVVVSNDVNSFTSTPVTLTLLAPAPVVEVQPTVTQTLLSGEPLMLAVQAGGRPPLTYTWKLGTTTVASGSSNTLLIPQTAVSQGGIYVCEVSNSTTTKATSDPAEVVVVDSSTRLTPVAIGGAAVLTAVVGAGPATALEYEWFKNGEVMLEEDFPAVTGIRERVLTLPDVTLDDDAFYSCQVKGPAENSVLGCTHDVRVFTGAPELPLFAFPDATIHAPYLFEIPFNRADRTKTPSSVIATGLPPGMVMDTLTGTITGRPNKFKKGGYAVKIVVSNSFGSVEQTAILNVNDLSGTLAGVWTGVMERNAVLNTGLGGRLDFTVTTLAAYSGKLTLGGVTYSFKGILDVGPVTSKITATIPLKGKPVPPPLVLTLTLQGNEVLEGMVTNGTAECELLSGWRGIWGKKAPLVPATEYAGYHTFGAALPAGSPLLGSTDVPQGSGYGSFTIAVDGKLKIAGRMPDGEAISLSTFLGPDGGIGIFQVMYKAIKPGGSLLGSLELTTGGNADPADNTLMSDDLTWVRPASTKATDRTYRNGFGIATSPVVEPVPLAAVGGFYKVPDAKANMVVLDMPMAPDTNTMNAEILFSDAGDLENPALTRWNPNQQASVGKNSKVTTRKKQPLAVPPVNPAGTTVAAAAKTGILTGGFTLEDRTPVGYVPVSTVKRAVKYQGIIINDGGKWVGVGYFLLPQLPQVGPPFTTTKNSPILSGLMLFEEL